MVKWTRLDRAAAPSANAVAAIRRGAREGTLIDAGSDQEFVTLLLRMMHTGDTVDRRRAPGMPCRPARSSRCRRLRPTRSRCPTASSPTPPSSSTRACVVKIFRKINEGIHPEIEIGRFLIEQTGYRNVPDLLGSIELVEGDQRSALVVAHRFVENQGDAWTVTGAYLGRFIDDQRVLSAAATPEESPELASYLQPLRQIARRTGELQTALASRPDIAGLRAGADRRGGHRGLDRTPGRAQQSHTRPAGREARRSGRSRAGPGRSHAGVAGGDHRAHPALAAGHHQRGEGPPPRRLPSRAGAGRQGRRVHPRLRGRAGPLARRAPARRRRRRATSPGSFARSTIRPPRRCSTRPTSRPKNATSSRRSWNSGATRRRRSSGPRAAGHRSGAVAVRSRRRRGTCSISSCSKKHFTKWNTN